MWFPGGNCVKLVYIHKHEYLVDDYNTLSFYYSVSKEMKAIPVNFSSIWAFFPSIN